MAKKKKVAKKNSKQVYMEKKATIASIVASKKHNVKNKLNKSIGLKQITVKNAEGDPDTTATILVQNKIDYVPKVSVIIPVYNVEQYLRECLDSVVNQTLKEIEIICVDDGSTDNSLEILKEYAKKDNRITIITQKNLYAGVARNAGLSQAKGEYLSFLDSDDFFELNMLEDMSKKADEDSSDIVICGFWKYDDLQHKNIAQITILSKFLNQNPIDTKQFSENLFFLTYPNPWTKLFRRYLFSEHNLHFEKFWRCNDFTCVYTALVVASRISLLNLSLVHYRINNGRSVTAKRTENVDMFLYAADKLEKNLKRLDLYNNCRENLINRINVGIDWEISGCTETQKEIIKNRARIILSRDLYDAYYGPKVSVIIPIYNVERYLGQCLDSVISQTLKEIEIICVDDGSTDNSLKIVREYANHDARIKILNQPHKKQGAARNLGVKNSLGKYIFFLDSDDWIETKCLEKLYNRITFCNADICLYKLKKYDEITKKIFRPNYFFYENLSTLGEIFSFKDFKSNLFLKWEPVTKLYKKDFLVKNDILFPEDVYYEDIYFHVKCMLLAKVCVLNEYLYFYRINRPHSTMYGSMNNQRLKTILDIFVALQGVLSYLKNTDNFDSLEYEYLTFMFAQMTQYKNILHNARDISTYKKKEQEFIEKNNLLASIKKYERFHNEYCNILSVKVTVIIPIYNVENYLCECLDSVINQTYKNLEIICINDGSTDNSDQILREYANKDNRVVVVDQENKGLPNARNTGLRKSTGQYIMFIDSDDWVDPEYIEKMYECVRNNNADMAKSGYKHHFVDKIIDDTINKIIKEKSIHDQTLKMYENSVTVWATLYKKEFLVRNNILYYDKDILRHEDILYTLKSTTFANKIVPVANTYYHYRRASSILSSFSYEKCYLIPEITRRALEFINANVKDEENYINSAQRLVWRLVDTYENLCVYQKFSKDKNLYKQQTKELIRKIKYSKIVIEPYREKLIRLTSNKEVIISLTSYPARIGTVSQTIETLLNQTMKADKVILWLAPEQFPNKEDDLPEELLILKDKGLTIDWYHDIRSYKKLIPALKKYPEDVIVTADDDALYEANWLEKLYQSYVMDANSIHCHRAHKIKLKRNTIAPYRTWEWYDKVLEQKGYCMFFTGLGGVLYPPHIFDKNVLDEEKCMKLCPHGDDIWFWGHAVLSKIKIQLIPGAIRIPKLIEGTQETGLWHRNVENRENDVQLKNVLKEYPQILKILKKENRKEYLKSYFLLPYYYWTIKKLKKQILKEVLQNIVSTLKAYRLDIKNLGTENNNILITIHEGIIEEPVWFTNKQGVGKILKGRSFWNKIMLHIINDGMLRIDFRGQDFRDNKTRLPVWIDYKSIKINGKDVLSGPIMTWHDKPWRYEMPVKNNQVVKIEIETQPHQYTKDELRDLILKLNPGSTYVKKYITKIADTIYAKMRFKKPSKLFSIVKTPYKKVYRFLGVKWISHNRHAELMDLVRQNQVETIKTLNEIKTKNTQLEKKNVELEKQIVAVQKELSANREILDNAQKNILSKLVEENDFWEQKMLDVTEPLIHSLEENKKDLLKVKEELLSSVRSESEQNQTLLQQTGTALSDLQRNLIQELYNNLSAFYVRREHKDNYYLEYRTFGELAQCIRQNINKVPDDIDLVVGVPRSGMIPAYMIALFKNRNCCSLDEFMQNIFSRGVRKFNEKETRKVLIVDDSCHSGGEMRRVKEKLAFKNKDYEFVYMAVYVHQESKEFVNIWMEEVKQPRVWQWNYLNHSIAYKSCFDLDGVLCVDPTEEENDDGSKYLDFIKNAKPLYIPAYKIHTIVTSRLEKYRTETEVWLKKHNVQYGQLVMLDLPSKEERIKMKIHAKFKAEEYKKLTETVLFVESNPQQAKEIALLSGKTVICVANDEIY